jgi:hypothetical protein
MNPRKALSPLIVVIGMVGASVSLNVFSQGMPAGGPGSGPGAMPSFSDFDLNKDGKITEEEFNDARAARIADRAQKGYPMRGLANASSFADIDTNHDGTLSPQEFAAHQASHRQPMRQ